MGALLASIRSGDHQLSAAPAMEPRQAPAGGGNALLAEIRKVLNPCLLFRFECTFIVELSVPCVFFLSFVQKTQ